MSLTSLICYIINTRIIDFPCARFACGIFYCCSGMLEGEKGVGMSIELNIMFRCVLVSLR